jgi:hypothetical protein
MTHCYTCQNRITKVRPFSYLIVWIGKNFLNGEWFNQHLV